MYAFRYCPDCGAQLQVPDVPSERLVSQTCAHCGAVHVHNAKPCAGALVVEAGKVLLGRRAFEHCAQVLAAWQAMHPQTSPSAE